MTVVKFLPYKLHCKDVPLEDFCLFLCMPSGAQCILARPSWPLNGEFSLFFTDFHIGGISAEIVPWEIFCSYQNYILQVRMESNAFTFSFFRLFVSYCHLSSLRRKLEYVTSV